MSEGFLWVCPQCGTSFTDKAFDDFNGQCKNGHALRDLVKHHNLLPAWRCKACGRGFSEPEYNIYDGKCSFHKNTDLEPIAPKESVIAPMPPVVAVETEEGEYDFGFGRPAPPPTPTVMPIPRDSYVSFDDVGGLRDQGLKESEPHQLSLGGTYGSEMEIVQRTIRVLVDKLGGKVELSGMEVIYIMQADDSPVPVIERETSTWGGRIILRTEGGK